MIHDMKDQPDDHLAPFSDTASEREWQAQENAMRRERLQLDSRHDDARTQRYRMLARSLRKPLDEELPADFAQQLAAQLGPARKGFDAPFESSLMIVLVLTLLVGSAVVLAPYSSQWWNSIVALLQSVAPSSSLLLALGGCIVLSGLVGHWSPTARKR